MTVALQQYNQLFQSINRQLNSNVVYDEALLKAIYDLRNRIILNIRLKVASAGLRLDSLVVEINQQKNDDRISRVMHFFCKKMLRVIHVGINQNEEALAFFLNCTLPLYIHRKKICAELCKGNLDVMDQFTGEKNLSRLRFVHLCSREEILKFAESLPFNILQSIAYADS